MQVYYQKNNPDRVVPVVLLHKKRRTIHLTAALGLLAAVIGLVGRQLRRRRPSPGETLPGDLPADPAAPGD